MLAFIAGFAFRKFGYPPLPGYLLAGFLAHGLGLGDVALISAIADIGILLLLFTIGLKLNLRDIAIPQVWAVAGLQALIAVPLTTAVIVIAGMLFPVLALQDTISAWVLAFALSFSSTVFAVKVFEDRGETAAFHARLAIGILVLQDLAAVVFLVATSDTTPGPLTAGLVLLVAARPILLWLLKMARHGELVMLFGVALALGAGELFELASLKAGLGALLAGLLLSNSDQSRELYKSLVGLTDLFLVGFFLQIGYYGLPDREMWLVAFALGVVIGIRPVIYYFLFVVFNLRARTAMLASSSLFSYSEFGLIVAALAVTNGLLTAEWMTTLALALSISFFIATPVNARIHQLYGVFGNTLRRFERKNRIPAEVPADLGDAEVVILGMGRVGQGAYQHLSEVYGDRIVGVEENYEKMLDHERSGMRCVHGDAVDYDFWAHSGLIDRKLILISLTNHQENLLAISLARQLGFNGDLAVVARFPDQRDELESLGCISFNLYAEAGHGFAEHVVSQTQENRA
jgi:predicted Kef-type K+ transport protein